MNKDKLKEEAINQSGKPKKRKVADGPIRSKTRTMAKLVSSIGKVLKKDGYAGLTITNVVKTSGVHQRLIYDHFGSLDNLITVFIAEKKFWINQKSRLKEKNPSDSESYKDEISQFLKEQFEISNHSKELQKIILWEISQKNKITQKLGNDREKMISDFIQSVNPNFEKSNVDLNAIMALLAGGIYYLNLNSGTKNVPFFGLDLNVAENRERIDNAIKLIVDLSCGLAEKNLQSEQSMK